MINLIFLVIFSKSVVPFDLTELECLANNIYFEARSEKYDLSKAAVGYVTLHRKNSKYWPNTICNVVYQQRLNKHKQWIPMYSWTKDGKSNIPIQYKSYNYCLKIAKRVLNGTIKDVTKNATHYHNTTVSPIWAKTLTKTIQLENHIFYK